MSTLVENASRIINAFKNIKQAIINKGQTPSGGVETYADAISSIESGIDVSDTTATPSSVMEDVEFYTAEGVKTSGTIQNLGYINWDVTDPERRELEPGYYRGGTLSSVESYEAGEAAGISQGASTVTLSGDAANLLSGTSITASNGKKIDGTMANNGATGSTINPGGSYTIPAGYTSGGTVTASSVSTETKTATPSTSDQTISPTSGKYLSSVTVKGVSVPAAGNILTGNSVTSNGTTLVTGSMNNCSGDKNTTLTSTDGRPVYAVDVQTSGDSSYWILNNADGVNRVCVKLNSNKSGYYPANSVVGLKTSLLGTTSASKSWNGATCTFSASAGYNASAVTSSTTLGASKSWSGATCTIYATADSGNRASTSTTLSTSGSWNGATYTHYAAADSANRASNSTTLTTKAAQSVTPTTSAQTIISSGNRYYFSGNITCASAVNTVLARGTFTSSSTAEANTTVWCGFQPTYVVVMNYSASNKITFNFYYNGSRYNVTASGSTGSIGTSTNRINTYASGFYHAPASGWTGKTCYYIACK